MSRLSEYQLSNPEPIDLRKLATKAESQGMYVVESERRGLMYIYNDGEFGIATTSNGMIRLTPLQVESVLMELAGIKDDVDELIKQGRRN